MILRFQAFLTGMTECYKFIQRIKNAEMTEFGLKGTHVACMFFLHHNPDGLTASQLCQLCAEDKANISRMVADLRQRGFIRQPLGKNYRKPLYLTESGKALAARMDSLIESWVTIGGEGLTEDQRLTFYHSLSLISDNLREKVLQQSSL